MTDERDTFRRMTEQFMNVNNTELSSLRLAIVRNADKSWPAEFKQGLRQAIDDGTVSAAEYERLTDNEFETDGEVRQWLILVWNFLYEGGPDPS